MNNIKFYIFFSCVFSAVLATLVFFSPNSFVKQYLHLIYLMHFLGLSGILFFLKEKMIFVMSPTFLTISYTYLTYILGGWAFHHGLVLWKNNLAAYVNWEYTNVMVSYSILCITLAYVSYFLIKKKVIEHADKSELKPWKTRVLVLLSVSCFFLFVFIKLDITSLGGLGDYNIIPKTLSALVLISVLALNRNKHRYLYYLLILVTFAAFSFESKREAVLLILSIFFLEIIVNESVKISLKKVGLILASLFLVIYLILAMSILRGYGNFNTTSFLDAVTLVPQYITQDDFIPAFSQNIETVISFYHSHQAIEYVEQDPNLLMYGETLIKFIFVPIPRSLIEKPTSIIEAYTSYYDASAYRNNNSWPINFFSELYWNFRYWGWVLVIPFFLFFNYVYLKLVAKFQNNQVVSSVVLLFMYQYFVFFVRGSGLDLYFFYLLLSTLVFSVFFVIPYSIIARYRRLKVDNNDPK